MSILYKKPAEVTYYVTVKHGPEMAKDVDLSFCHDGGELEATEGVDSIKIPAKELLILLQAWAALKGSMEEKLKQA